jgi:two-component sensor histidine kinase
LALSLAIHELATNALKYGALTVAGGHVSVTWAAEDQEGMPNFIFTWQESGGPPAAKPSATGFGSRLISRVLADDFRGSVELSYASTGLVCLLTAPLDNLGLAPANG